MDVKEKHPRPLTVGRETRESRVKCFTTTGICTPEKNYMADTSEKIRLIADSYVSCGKYFTINRARQYGKTTTLYLLEEYLKKDYIVLSLSFESADELFASLYTLAAGLVRRIGRILKAQNIHDSICSEWLLPVSKEFPFDDLGQRITELCAACDKELVLMIDEVDKSSDNQIFLSFLGLLREKYLNQMKGKDQTFCSVILAGVYDVKNLKLKLHRDAESKYNSPWNIAVDFELDMSLSAKEIESMLQDYENDWRTGMNIAQTSTLLYEYTSGYPFLVSRLCQLMARGEAPLWNWQSFQNALREILRTSNTLFDDMSRKLAEYSELKEMIYSILFQEKNMFMKLKIIEFILEKCSVF